MSAYRTCRHCLGTGCIHCSDRGQVRDRIFTDREMAQATLLRATRAQLGLDQTPERPHGYAQRSTEALRLLLA